MFAVFMFLALSVVFYFNSSEAGAEPQAKKDILSAYLFSTAALPGANSADGNSRGNKFQLHLKEGLNAFIDFGQPEHRGLKLKENDRDYRAIFGLHIPLR